MKVFIFDLDDTLYEELQFVKSGFRAVANYLLQNYKINEQESYSFMLEILERDGRGAVFNTVLYKYGIFSLKNVQKCISVYRFHEPDIKLSDDAEQVLENLKGSPLYVVTDGNKLVQRNKVLALGLEKVKKIYITHRYGRKHSKPSPYCFSQIAQSENASYSDMLYVGDNPNKDFVGIKPLGVRTIQIQQGGFYNLDFEESYRAEATIERLTGLFEVIRQWEE